jgi:hypothetical protein
MTVAETITEKISHLPIKDQQQVLQLVEQIELRQKKRHTSTSTNGEVKHALTLLAEMAVDMGVTDLADRHDYYAHGKLED